MDSLYEAVSRAKSSVILEKKKRYVCARFLVFLREEFKNIHSD